jgi:hypothetical protein
MNARIAYGVAQNKLKKFRISTSFGGCERKVLLAICLDIANILGVWAKMRKTGSLAKVRDVRLRKLRRMANFLPILEMHRIAVEIVSPLSPFAPANAARRAIPHP